MLSMVTHLVDSRYVVVEGGDINEGQDGRKGKRNERGGWLRLTC